MLLVTLFVMNMCAYGGVYRWVDSNGKVHYGDKVPPDFAQSGHTKINKNGTEETVESAAAKQRRKKLAAIKKEREQQIKEEQRKKDLQEMRDTQLLSTFNNIDELIRVYESKLEMTDGTISVLKVRHKNLSGKLEALEARHEKMVNPNDKNMLGIEIDEMIDNLHVYQQAITENLVERTQIEERYQRDLVRYKSIYKKRKTATP